MFFDRENCSAIRVLHEISEFIESSIDKLLDLEKETLQILNNKSSTLPTTKPLESVRVKQEPIEELGGNSLLSSSQGLQNIPHVMNTSSRYYDSVQNTSRIRVMPEAFLKERIYSTPNNCGFLVNKVAADKRKHDTSELNVSMENEYSINKMIKKEPEISTCGNTLSSCSSCALINLNGNAVGKSVTSSCNNFNDFNNKCKNPSKDINEQCSSLCFENIQPLAGTLKETNAMAVPELCTSVSADKCFKARVKFKKSFSASEVKELLTNVEINGITDITVTKKYAVIALCSKTNLKVLLSMNNENDLRKIKASCIEKVKKTCSTE